jgi:predicted dienelactone hydrolase
LSAWLLYPTEDAAQTVRFGPYPLELAMNGRPAGADDRALRVVALSHGSGGTPWSHRGLADHLVRAGFAVVMIEHSGNNRRDNSLGSPTGRLTPALLQHRPRHVTIAIDAALADPQAGPRLERDRFAMVGESAGAYTALAVAGGHAVTVPDEVEDARLMEPDDEVARLAFSVPTERDHRLCAAVLLAPAIDFFLTDGALRDVEIPLLVRTGARDALCPSTKVATGLRSVADAARVTSLEVEGAGHFSFQTPYPPELSHIPPAQDPPGFDRARYQPTLHADVTNFLEASFPAASPRTSGRSSAQEG